MSKIYGMFKTPRGSELPLLDLKGKPYLQVAHRIVWFREMCPSGVLKTQVVATGGTEKGEFAVFKAEVYIPNDQGSLVLVATGHKKETRGGFEDFLEKAETGAIGRALALAGFGTAFTGDELVENDRLADAPIDPAGRSKENTNAVIDAVATVATTTGTRRPSFRKNVTVAKSTTTSTDDI